MGMCIKMRKVERIKIWQLQVTPITILQEEPLKKFSVFGVALLSANTEHFFVEDTV
jgi:hypothetical protein